MRPCLNSSAEAVEFALKVVAAIISERRAQRGSRPREHAVCRFPLPKMKCCGGSGSRAVPRAALCRTLTRHGGTVVGSYVVLAQFLDQGFGAIIGKLP